MTSRDLFGLVLRIGAAWLFVWGCWQLVAAAVYLPSTIESVLSRVPVVYSSIHYAAYGLPAVLFSVLVLRFAEAILVFTYRR